MSQNVLQKIETPDPPAARFRALGIESVSYAHPPVFRVGEDDGFIRHMPGGHTKNLFLKDKKGQAWLVTALQDTEVDLKWLRKRLGAAQMSFGSPALLEELLGVTPGAVTPLALMNDREGRVRFVLDARILACDTVNCHPLRNDRTTGLAPAGLLKFLEDVGVTPVVVDFREAGPI